MHKLRIKIIAIRYRPFLIEKKINFDHIRTRKSKNKIKKATIWMG